ncbi:MAG: hemerythrin domain-containing protein [Planctomycetaceae bacterium]|nr:hemerythrin domain-containing protein [Planctomycetaceae bacterium]
MNSLDAIDVLEAEHRTILKVVGTMAVLADVVQSGQDKCQTIGEVLEFLQTYVGQCHHVKEEQHLFPALTAKGVPAQGCPIGALVHEHQKLHALMDDLARSAQMAGQSDPAAEHRLRELAEMYPGHIWKEDYLLFPMSRKVLLQDDLEALNVHFSQADRQIGLETRRRLEGLAQRLYEECLISAT